VTFQLNQDRILEAAARDLATGNEVSITIAATDNRLSDDDKSRMTREARMRVTSMLEQRLRETLHNQAESLVYRAERLIANYDDPLADDARNTIEELQKALDDNDQDRINNRMQFLTEILHKLEAAEY